ncbi:O-antigen ligase family protein [Roseomonas sp. HJA6]|uniref:O-antigen ligase family protein n=2 Tax=Roseomonas alba TaxID=2846776 RepID=A0ABS7A2F8_9PROT|nr:O-antigen ligase family protein [Neoroseomonas alba]
MALIYVVPAIGLAFMLFTSTVLQVPGSEQVTGLPLSLNKIAGIVTLAAWGARSVVNRVPITWSPVMPALLSFVAVVVLSGFVTANTTEYVQGMTLYIQLAALTIMVANIGGENDHALNVTCVTLSTAMTASTLLAFAEFLLPSLAIEYEDAGASGVSIGAQIDSGSLEGVEIKRVTGGLEDANWFGYTLVGVLPINLYLFHRFATTGARLVILAMAGLQSMGIVLSLTRSALIGFAVALIWLVIRRRLPLGPLVAAAILGGIGIAAWNPAGLERIYSISYAETGGSTPIRSYYLWGGISLIQERPLFGYGYSQFGPNLFDWFRRQPRLPPDVAAYESETLRRAAIGEDSLALINAHNMVVQVWVEFGLLGLLTFAALCALLLRDLALVRRYGAPPHRLLADCLFASTVGFLACGAFGAVMLIKMPWILAGFAAALRRVAFTADAGLGVRGISP